MTLLFWALSVEWFGEAYNAALNYCESPKEGMIKQPANTWSNLSFMIAGLAIAFESFNNKHIRYKNKFSQTLFFPTSYATLAILLCPGSMAMHASTASLGGYFDMLSMYLLASFMFAYAIVRFLNRDTIMFILVFFIALASCHYVHFHDGEVWGFINIDLIFGFFTVGSALIEFLNIKVKKIPIEKKWFFFYCLSFISAFAIWLPSQTGKPLCNPESLLQGHAIWHILCGLTVYLIYRFYVSENRIVSE